MKKVLLTGATGFLGRCCFPSLIASGYEVHAVSTKAPPDDLWGARWHHADLLDLRQTSELMAGVRPTHLLHLAWYTVPGKYWTSSENLSWVQASLHLLQEFASGGGQRVVSAGTCAEYDWESGYCSEKATMLRPTTLYGTCKHALQIMLDAFAARIGFSAAWGRIFFLYGPHEHPDRLVASIISSVLQNKVARCSHGNQIRDFLYIQDAAEAFVALLNSDVTGPVNVASGCPIALKDVIRKIAEKLNSPHLIELGGLPVRENEPPRIIADVGRLRNEVGWQPRDDLDSGLDQTIDWWKTRVFGSGD